MIKNIEIENMMPWDHMLRIIDRAEVISCLYLMAEASVRPVLPVPDNRKKPEYSISLVSGHLLQDETLQRKPYDLDLKALLSKCNTPFLVNPLIIIFVPLLS